MGRKKKAQSLMEQLNEVRIDQVEAYMRMFDRILLYTIASNIMPKEALDKTLSMCDKVVKKGMDLDVQFRTNFLEATPQGRLLQMKKDEPDGEELRLEYLKTWDVAKELIKNNLDGARPSEEAFGED
jgi:hypothetical protein